MSAPINLDDDKAAANGQAMWWKPEIVLWSLSLKRAEICGIAPRFASIHVHQLLLLGTWALHHCDEPMNNQCCDLAFDF